MERGEKRASQVPAPASSKVPAPVRPRDPFVRAANEDDDGYDPYSDRPTDPEPRFEPDPWK